MEGAIYSITYNKNWKMQSTEHDSRNANVEKLSCNFSTGDPEEGLSSDSRLGLLETRTQTDGTGWLLAIVFDVAT